MVMAILHIGMVPLIRTNSTEPAIPSLEARLSRRHSLCGRNDS